MPPADRAPGSTRRDPTILLVIAGVLLLARIAAGIWEARNPPSRVEQVSWHRIDLADSLSRATGKPILYDFTADWCPPCKLMKKDVFSDQHAAQIIENTFVPVRVLDRSREDGRNRPEVQALEERFRIESFPTLVVTAPSDSEPVVMAGYAGKDRTLNQLMRAAASVRGKKPGSTGKLGLPLGAPTTSSP